MTTAPPESSAASPRRTWVRRLIWVAVSLLVLWVAVIAVRGAIAAVNLRAVAGLTSTLASQIGKGDAEGARNTATDITEKTGTARQAARGIAWGLGEGIPFLGQNFTAVRQAAIAGDDLANDAMVPAASIDARSIGPSDGAFNLDALSALERPVARMADAVQTADLRMELVETQFLLPPVADAVGQLTEQLDALGTGLQIAREVLPVLPEALGAHGPRNYIFMFPNNAEARSTGGNPASISYVTADAGRLEITNQASSTDFFNGIDREPILPLDYASKTLYGDKIGKFIQDTMMPVDFMQTSALVQANWAERFGTPVDGVISFDPVALSYLLRATGPVNLPTGDTLSADGAVDLLLHDIYYRYPTASGDDRAAQDVFFNAAAGSVFLALTSGQGDMLGVAGALQRAGAEGRLMMTSNHENIQSLVEGTRLLGPFGDLSWSNTRETAMGVFVNDETEGKLDYYDRLAITAEVDRCSADETTYTLTTDFRYTLPVADVEGLPYYIHTERFFPKGFKRTNFVFYGPVGAEYVGTTIDGTPYEFDHISLVDQERPALRIRVDNEPETGHVFEVTFTTPADEHAGPLSVRHTPLTSEVPIEVREASCG